MVVTKQFQLPTEEELTVPELNVTAAAYATGAFHLGKYCEEPCKEFMLCRDELNDPRKCLAEGKQVTACGIEFFKKVKKSCLAEFTQYQKCLISSSADYQYAPCRKTQNVFDECVKAHLGVERPRPYYYCEPKIHDSKRPKPPPATYPKYDDATPGLPAEKLKDAKTTYEGQGIFDGGRPY
ncbi:NADH dehydrogenase [ubiquinone] 1 alpha subcomplex subunit 8 [Frankliniella fusca]|uniref:NADH dehydrogenase [ubiquinone] 1 alpha subcomplex subunit 8 n=1 Tax=Frankliniella fusca TaxID=407009 RepID=A0AAE1LM59_9NEOP|nr:NADH dehydrogenase [ubiquinone] 1 alpha subcomplex subunit 8 [Frankliniella fusca]